MDIEDNEITPVFSEVITDKYYESDKCFICGDAITGEEARVYERRVGYYAPRFYAKANIETFYIRKHFMGHK